MRYRLPITLLFVVLISIPLRAEGPRRSVRHGSQPADPNVRMVWIADSYASWEDAAAAFVSNKGQVSILRTNDAETPYIVLRQVPSGSYAAFPPPKYVAVTFPQMNDAMPFIAGATWWRGLTIADGSALIVMLNP